MREKNPSPRSIGSKIGYGCSGGCLSGFLGLGVGIAQFVGILTLGPIDLTRTTYNSLVGDLPLIRERAVDYCRENIQRENPTCDVYKVEEILAKVKNEEKIEK